MRSAKRFELWLRQVALAPLVGAASPLLYCAAFLWRWMLVRTTFVAVTGSLGKTTATRLLAGILSTRGRTFHTIGNQNSGFMVALNVLRVRPWHRYAVIEVGIDEPGVMRRLARTVRPDIAVILGVAPTHTTSFASLDEHADEKAVLFEYLSRSGTGVLNGDDPRAARIAARTGRRICYFGARSQFDVWVDKARARWPERLSFEAHAGGETCEIQTMLSGAHWLAAAAGALAVASVEGIRLADAAKALGRVMPHAGRMDPVLLPNGAVVVRDDYNGAVASMKVALRFLREARAGRRILVLSDFSDAGVNRRMRLRWLAEEVAGWLDVLVLAGSEHGYGRRRMIEAGMRPEGVHSFRALREAGEFLRGELRSGDVALVKGRTTDHVGRLLLAQCGTIVCWREYCRKTMLCDTCWELGFQPRGEFVPPSLGAFV
jgi:UDP-N-acetylmuramoyl-tripeptide--D-alanyl-D-alanine ligase